jgi:hypothetical protein
MPLPPSFSIKNSGYFSAYSVQIFCDFINIKTIFSGKEIIISNSSHGPTSIINTLSSNQVVDHSCAGIVGPLAKESDIGFLVSYQPAYYWKRFYACARFVIKENAYGKLQWFRTEPQECKLRWVELQNRRDKGKADSEALRKRFSK